MSDAMKLPTRDEIVDLLVASSQFPPGHPLRAEAMRALNVALDTLYEAASRAQADVTFWRETFDKYQIATEAKIDALRDELRESVHVTALPEPASAAPRSDEAPPLLHRTSIALGVDTLSAPESGLGASSPPATATTPSRARLLALRERWAALGVSATHYEGCEEEHYGCAIRLALDAALHYESQLAAPPSHSEDAERLWAIRVAAAKVLYRVREWAPEHVNAAAIGIGPVNTDAGAALSELRVAASVKLDADGYPFVQRDKGSAPSSGQRSPSTTSGES